MRQHLDRLVTVVMVAAAAAVATGAVHREFFRVPGASATTEQPTYYEEWQDWARKGILVGDSSADIKILQFVDLQCPFCKRFHDALRNLPPELEDTVAVIFVHYPVAMHPSAMSAARAVECADTHGKFWEYADAIFRDQDSLGSKSWGRYAADAGIADTADVAVCVNGTDAFPRIHQGLELGSQIGIRGTPTVVINGWWLPVAPYESLVATVRQIQAAEEPYRQKGPRRRILQMLSPWSRGDRVRNDAQRDKPQ